MVLLPPVMPSPVARGGSCLRTTLSVKWLCLGPSLGATGGSAVMPKELVDTCEAEMQ